MVFAGKLDCNFWCFWDVPEKVIKTALKVIGITAILYTTISSCAVTTVFVLDQSLKNTESSELFPN